MIKPPDLEILEIGDLSKDRFRGIFRLTYGGDAHIVLSTKVQANPLSKPSSSSASNSLDGETFAPFSTGSATRGILFAATPLVVPMQLRLSHVRLRAIIVLVVSKTKGITLVFKNDPLESVQVSSTFDSVAVIAKYLQQEIEGQLKEVFREDLPGIIHRLSQGWLNGQRPKAGNGGKSTAASKGKTKAKSKAKGDEASDRHGSDLPSVEAHAQAQAQPPTSTSGSRRATRKSGGRRKSAGMPADATKPGTSGSHTSSKELADDGYLPPLSVPSRQQSFNHAEEDSFEIPLPFSTSFEDIEAHDPTYGLRPDEVRLPRKGQGFKGLKSLKRGMSSGMVGLGGGSQSGFGLGGILQDEALDEERQRPTSVTAAEVDRQQDGQLSDDEDEDDDDARADDDGRSEWASEDGVDGNVRPIDADDNHVHDEDDGSGSLSAVSSSSSSSNSPRRAPSPPRSNLDFVDPFEEHFSDFTKFGYSATTNATSPAKSSGGRRSSSSRQHKKASSAFVGDDAKGTERLQRPRPSLSTAQSAHGGLAGLNSLTSPSSASLLMGSPLSRTASSSGVGPGTGGRIVQQHQRLAARENGSNVAHSDSGVPPARRPTASRQMSTTSIGSAASLTRPRILHASSLIRPPDWSESGAGGASEDYHGSSIAGSTYGYGRYLTARGARAGSSTIGRSDGGGGTGSTVIGNGGSGGGPTSAVGSSRTFTIGKKSTNGSVGAGSAVGSGSVARTRDLSRDRYGSSPLKGPAANRGEADDDDDDEDEDGEDIEARDVDSDDYSSEARDAFPPARETSSNDDSSHSNSRSSYSYRKSKAGTLATLDPEPMSESGSAYKRDVWKERYSNGKGFYRPGWEKEGNSRVGYRGAAQTRAR